MERGLNEIAGMQAEQVNTGGHALPVDNHATCAGMTLRQWYAGMALSGAIECCQRGFINAAGPEQIAATCFEIADAMLAVETVQTP